MNGQLSIPSNMQQDGATAISARSTSIEEITRLVTPQEQADASTQLRVQLCDGVAGGRMNMVAFD